MYQEDDKKDAPKARPDLIEVGTGLFVVAFVLLLIVGLASGVIHE